MEIVKDQKYRDVGSCSFCNSGELNKEGNGKVRPYQKVTVLNSDCGTVTVRVCPKCMSQLKLSSP